MKHLLKEVRENKVFCIVVKDLSRFGRNYIEVGNYIEQLFPAMGVRFISIADHYDNFHSLDKIEISFQNIIHDFYSRDLSKKIKSVKWMYQEKGIKNGGDVAYGYRNDKPDPKAAKIVRMIFSLAAKGEQPSNIAKYLNQERILTPGAYKNQTGNQNYSLKNEKSNFWTSAQVRKIIENEVYLGTFVCHKTSSIRPKERKQNEEKEYIKHENHHEALISKTMFETAQKAILKQGKRGNYKKDTSHLLKGKVKCGYCGYSMTIGKKSSLVYSCRMGDSCGFHVRIEVQTLENVILKLLEPLTEKANPSCLKLEKVKREKRILDIKLEHCKNSRLYFYCQWKKQQITKEEYLTKKERILRQEADLGQKLQNRNNLIEQAASLQSYPNIQIKQLAEEWIQRIEVYSTDRIEITF